MLVTSQERGEVGHLAPADQYLKVKLGGGRVGDAALFSHFGRDVPDHVFNANIAQQAFNTHRSRTLLVLNRVGLDKILTHRILPRQQWNGSLGHLLGNLVSLPNRQADEGELAAVPDGQVGNIVCLPPFVDNAVLRLCAHAAGAHVVVGRAGWRAKGLDGTCGLVTALDLGKGVIAHGNVVFMVVKMHIEHILTLLLFDLQVERDAPGLAWHVFAHRCSALKMIRTIVFDGVLTSVFL